MAKKIIDEREIELTLEALPKRPKAESMALAEEWMKETEGFVFRASTYRDPISNLSTPAVRGTCSACGEDAVLDRAYVPTISGCHCGGYSEREEIGFFDPEDGTVMKKHGDPFACPRCGSNVEAVHVSRIRDDSYRLNYRWVGEVHNVRGHLAVVAWFFEKFVDKLGVARTEWHPNEAIFIVDGSPYRACGYRKVMANAIHQLDRWQKYSKYTDSFGLWSKEEMICDPAVIDTTDSPNCGLHKLLEDGGKNIRIGAYLWMWTKFPAIENLVTSGHTYAVKKLIDHMTRTSGYYYEKQSFNIGALKTVLDTKAVKPHDILRCRKGEIELIKELGVDRFLFRGIIYRTYGVILPRDRIEQCCNEGLDTWYTILKKKKGFDPPLERTLNYLDRQKRKCLIERIDAELKTEKARKKRLESELALANEGSYSSLCIVSASYLRDYWTMLEKVYGSYPEELRYPKDLVKAHDDVQKRVREKECEALRAKFLKRYAELDRLSMQDEGLGLMIRPCKTQMEMIEEGKFLHHCVGSYANRHANGSTAIFFIRKIEKPDEPFYTLEYKDDRVDQNRGMKNADRTEEVKDFEQKWLKYIEKIKAKGETNGKHDRNESVRAGA